jgi:ribonuclease VapC
MIVDSSALVAVAKRESDWELIAARMDKSEPLCLSAVSYLETAIVLDGLRNPVVSGRLDALIQDMKIAVEPVTMEQAQIARDAYRNFGKSSGHRANLNFGDCFSYALARVKREPILFKGDHFEHTDLRSALDHR